MPNEMKEAQAKLRQLTHEMLEKDQALREQFQVGDKFRFIRDRLQALATQIEEGLEALTQKTQKIVHEVAEDEVYIYVHLYNAQGLTFKTWQKMVAPSVFYEYSVNRPIYTEKAQIDSFIRSRNNKIQHGYLTIIIKKEDILKAAPVLQKDVIGNDLVKVKEGSLRFNRLVSFTHNEHEFTVNASGELERKT